MTQRLDHLLLAAFVVLAVLALSASGTHGCTGGPTPVLSQDAHRPVMRGLRQADYLFASQACAHENSYDGGVGGTFDCGAQIQVFLTRRLQGETLSHVIARLMPRFAAGTTRRSWVLHLPWGPLRENPPGWPALYPARHDDDRWHGVVTRVRGFLSGHEELPCSEPPEAWFGRYVDHEAIEHRRQLGWREISCNPGGRPETETLELYMARPQ